MLKNMRLALATNSENPQLVAGEQLLPAAFGKQGITAGPAVWNDPAVEWTDFDTVILRCCWGYYRQIDGFYAWLDRLSGLNVPVLNLAALVRWNSHKKYLLDLQAKGVSIPATMLIRQSDTRNLADVLAMMPGAEFIVKPCYGAAAFGLLKISRPAGGAEAAYRQLLEAGDVLVQQFIPEITGGEYSAVFLGNRLSHVVLKVPKTGDFRSNFEFGGQEKLVEPDEATLQNINRLYAQCDVDTLYARMDVVITGSSDMLLMELELIEPYLYFDQKPGSADLFVSAFIAGHQSR